MMLRPTSVCPPRSVSSNTASGVFSYPDLVFVCGEAEYFDEHRDVHVGLEAVLTIPSIRRTLKLADVSRKVSLIAE